MKYMGSKQTMLLNGLGETIAANVKGRKRVVDLFCGSGAVAWHCAEHTDRPVIAVDLQRYAVALAAGLITRTRPVDSLHVGDRWLATARRSRSRTRLWREWSRLDVDVLNLRKRDVLAARAMCSSEDGGMVWNAYGGHYFSPAQALTFDLLKATLPERSDERSVALAALIATASRCAASPGHTAQPFRPTQSARPFIGTAWAKDPLDEAQVFLDAFASRFARKRGHAYVGDAVVEASTLTSDDLVILDPPYSAVQYSRFYHVLETVAAGYEGEVTGAGRYPPLTERPSSDFSLKSQADGALDELLGALSEMGCSVILTFPAADASNGLSGERVKKLARQYFRVLSTKVAGRFSTLGGNNDHRQARHDSEELILALKPL